MIPAAPTFQAEVRRSSREAPLKQVRLPPRRPPKGRGSAAVAAGGGADDEVADPRPASWEPRPTSKAAENRTKRVMTAPRPRARMPGQLYWSRLPNAPAEPDRTPSSSSQEATGQTPPADSDPDRQ